MGSSGFVWVEEALGLCSSGFFWVHQVQRYFALRERESENEESERDGKQRNEEELYLAHCRFRERRDV